MIEILDKIECCGCNACVQRCPTQCLSMQEDNEGFLYPQVQKNKCINCGLCEKVCPVINQGEKRNPTHVYAAINENEDIRLESSSGGIFTLLAEKIVGEGGVVFGACFDKNWEVKHDYTDNVEGISKFRGSKYVQSRIGDTYKQVESFLKSGVKVLFSGTPCQIAGLRNYLRVKSENLCTVDFICHGVPSPEAWRMYLAEMGNPIGSIESINFRSKISGWKEFSLSFQFRSKDNIKNVEESHKNNIFMRAFLSDMTLRPSCHHCPAKQGKSGSDITIADYWGIQSVYPDMDDDRGTSLVMINSEIGERVYNSINVHSRQSDFDIHFNKAFSESAARPKLRDWYWKRIHSAHSFQSTTLLILRIVSIERLLMRMIRKLQGLFIRM